MFYLEENCPGLRFLGYRLPKIKYQALCLLSASLLFSSPVNRTLAQINSDFLFSNTVTYVSHSGSDLPELNNAFWQGKSLAEFRGNVKEVRLPGMSIPKQTLKQGEDNNEYRLENIDGMFCELQYPIHLDRKHH